MRDRLRGGHLYIRVVLFSGAERLLSGRDCRPRLADKRHLCHARDFVFRGARADVFLQDEPAGRGRLLFPARQEGKIVSRQNPGGADSRFCALYRRLCPRRFGDMLPGKLLRPHLVSARLFRRHFLRDRYIRPFGVRLCARQPHRRRRDFHGFLAFAGAFASCGDKRGGLSAFRTAGRPYGRDAESHSRGLFRIVRQQDGFAHPRQRQRDLSEPQSFSCRSRTPSPDLPSFSSSPAATAERTRSRIPIPGSDTG